MIIKTKSGKVQGLQENGLYLFKGIPYAVAKRFMAPQPYSWEGVLEAVKFGPKACQRKKNQTTLEGMDENCLNLNIYTPSLEGNLSVLVEIHGGAFQTGSNQGMDPYHVVGDKPMIYVTINYRLGAFGYLYLGEAYPTSGNNGTLDQLAALKWIHENISAFGGNPNKVTLLGSSAGAKSIGALMSHPLSKTYFQQVILISGAYQSVRDKKTATVVAERFKTLAGVTQTEELLDLSVEEILQAQSQLCSGFGSTCLFGPVADGCVIPVDFYDQLHQDTYWSGKAIIGSSKSELIFYKWMSDSLVDMGSEIAKELFGSNADIAIEDAKALSEKMDGSDAWVKVLSDYMYRTYSYRMAQLLVKNGSTVWQCSTELKPACHCLDHTLSLQTPDHLDKIYADVEDKSELLKLGEQIRKAYLSFVVNGEPMIENWLPLNQEQVQMIWDLPMHTEAIKEKPCDRFPEYVFRLE